MEEIVSIHSIVHKKKKNIVKNKNPPVAQVSPKIIKKIKSNSMNKSIIKEKIMNNINKDIHSSIKKNTSQKKHHNLIYIYKKYDFEKTNEPILCTNDNNIKIFSEKYIKSDEDSFTPVMNLQRNKKPNYLMKSAFIKDKSLTPQEKSFQKSLCPIYDFYKGNSGFNTSKNESLLKNTSFTQYYNNFKKNDVQNNEYLNPSLSPLTNLSDKNNMNYYYNFSFLAKKQTGKDFFEQEKINKINEVFHDKSSSFDDQENNNQIDNIEKDENNTPSNMGGTISPSYDFFDENIFGNDNNSFKSPINYKQMNVNININNNSQNNNIYYQLPNIINNFNNNSNNNYFNNNANNNNNNEMNFNNMSDINNNNFNENISLNQDQNQNNNLMNSVNNNINFVKQQNNENDNNNIEELKKMNFRNNLANNLYNNNQINLSNLYNFNKDNNNQNILQNQMNLINQLEKQKSPYINLNLNQNQVDNGINQLNQLSRLNQNIANYLNQYLKANNNNNINNNNINKINEMLLQNLNNNINNNNINYNINNNTIKNNKNINFSSIANAYMNQSLLNQNIYNTNNNNGNLNKMQIPISNINNNNGIYNNALKYYLYNQERASFQNNNNPNINNQMNTNFAYMNNLNNMGGVNNFNQNNGGMNQNLINNHNNIPQNNNAIPESFFYSLTPIQLAQQCHIIAKNQNGCRYLQNYIISNTDLLQSLFFPKILEHLTEISNDQFANYLVKKIFQYLNEDMIIKLIQILNPIIDQIGTNQYGTRVLQDLIDFLKTEKTFMAFIKIIIPHIKLLITDLNGSHIIYKLILTKNKNVKIIENIVCLQVKDIAITRKGCSFLKKYFDFANESDLVQIKKCILENLSEIITDQYGNYVIQSILTKKDSPIVEDFINEISKNIVFYSNNKFSSNAVEKCFENENKKNEVLDKFLQKDIFEKIILDKFGNYVVQKAISKADKDRKNYMLQLLIPLIPNLKSQYFGQRLLSRLIMQYPNLNIN